MANTPICILIVDDDPHMIELLGLHVESVGYTVLQASNGREALVLLDKTDRLPDAVISDVEMPEVNGYELCSQLRGQDKTHHIPFIFVSAKTTLDEKLKGYEVGGDEYITKPIEGDEVILKVRYIIENRVRHAALNQQLKDSHSAAMQAMSYTSNLGLILQFMKEVSQVSDFPGLADKVLDVTSALGLSVIIQFHTPVGIQNYRREGSVTPLEANVIEMARNKGRFFDFQARTIINYTDFSMLLMNMPVGDAEKYGLIKDILGNLCDAIEVKVKQLLTNVIVQRKDEVINTVSEALDRIDRSYRDIQAANLSEIDTLIHRVEEVMFGFGLTEEQEDVIRGIILYAKNKSTEIFEDGKELYDDFEAIHNTLVNGLK